MRELQSWVAFGVGRSADGLHRYGRLQELGAGWRENTQQGTLSDRAGASLHLRNVRWVGRSTGAVRPGVEWRSRAKARLNFSAQGQSIRKMQGQPACRAGEPSGQGEEPPPEGLGGHDLLTQTDAGCPAGQVVGHRLDGQPGAVGGEAA